MSRRIFSKIKSMSQMPAEMLNLHFLKEKFNLPIATIKLLYQ